MATVEIWREVGTGRPLTAEQAWDLPEEQTRLVVVECHAECVCDGVPCEVAIESHGETLTQDEVEQAQAAAEEAWLESEDGRAWERSERRSEEQYRQGSYRW